MRKIYVSRNVYNTNCLYGYEINITEPNIAPLYLKYKKSHNIPPHYPMSDRQRYDFEISIKRMIATGEIIVRE